MDKKKALKDLIKQMQLLQSCEEAPEEECSGSEALISGAVGFAGGEEPAISLVET